MPTIIRGFFGLVAALFAYAAFLQLNDPDPLLWVVIYLVAAGVAALTASNHPAPTSFAGGTALIALAWAAFIGSKVYGDGSVQPMFPQQQMTGWLIIDTEEGREMGGLLVIATAMALLVITQLASRYKRPRGRGPNLRRD